MSDRVSVGFPEGVRWDVGIGKGWDALGGGLGVTGSQKLQECGGPSVRLTICRGAPHPRSPAWGVHLCHRTPVTSGISCPSKTQTSPGLNSLALENYSPELPP